LRVIALFATAIFISAAPAGAALPEEGVRACRQLESELVFIGQAGVAFRYRLFQEQIDRAREMVSKAKAAHDKAPHDIDLLLSVLAAESDLENWTIKSFEMTLVPMKIERVFRGNPAGESFVVLGHDMKLETGRSYVFYGEARWAMFNLEAYEGWTQEVLNAADALRVLDASATSGGGIVYGSLDLEHTSERDRSSPLAGVSIRLTAPGYLDHVTTDADGTFIATNVRPGPVTITPMVPESLGIANRALLRATVAPGRCVSMNLRAAPNGRIRGEWSARMATRGPVFHWNSFRPNGPGAGWTNATR
jgi:hypothetical protein